MKPIRFLSLIFFFFIFAAGAAFAANLPQQQQQNRKKTRTYLEFAGPKVIRVSGQVQAAKVIYRVVPVYPEEAKKAGIQGTVVLHALIGKNGAVRRLEYLSGPPILIQSALNAVRQWRYKPTLLNDKPVAVNTEITVTYTLSGPNGAKPEFRYTPRPGLPPPFPPEPPAASLPLPFKGNLVRVSAQEQAARLIHHVVPVYPPKAKKAGIQGKVVLQVLIGVTGRVKQVHYVSGPRPLVQSAIDAVRQWEYKPKLVNGKPVEIETEVTVIYSLGNSPSAPI